MSAQYSMAQLDAMAREKGFPDYATWRAWNEKYRSSQQGTPTQSQQKPKNWFQTLVEKISWHPANTLNKVHDAFQQKDR